MESFHWNDRFLTGLPEVDAQHLELVTLINRFGDALTDGTDRQPADIDALFADLTEYARSHFAAEERLMGEVAVDPRHVRRQREQHGAFARQLDAMRGASRDDAEGDRRVMTFLARWLANHILGVDVALGRQVVAIRAGVSPEEAYRVTESSDDREALCTEPLLDALNDLYREVAARNRELVALNRSLEARVAERTAALMEANRRLEVVAMTDALTGLPNRRHALARLDALWSAATTSDDLLSLMLIDADGFKQVNDVHGHDAGDLVLRTLAHALQDRVRTDDLACRLGGDEFLVLCPDTPLSGALHLAELLRSAVGRLRVPAGDGVWIGSVSVGVAARDPGMSGPEALIKAADEGVYLAKAGGRNRVACAQRDAARGARTLRLGRNHAAVR